MIYWPPKFSETEDIDENKDICVFKPIPDGLKIEHAKAQTGRGRVQYPNVEI